MGHEAGNLNGGGAEDAEIGGAGQGAYRRKTGNPHDRFDRGVDRVDDAAKPPSDQVGQNLAPDAVGIGAHPDEGDALGLEDRIEIVDIHG